MFPGQGIPQGKITRFIYDKLQDGKFQEVITFLLEQLQCFPRNRAALSLLAYAYYHAQDFDNAATTYEKLTKFYPEAEDYRLYYAQSLYKASRLQAADNVCRLVSTETFERALRVGKLRAAVLFGQEDIVTCQSVLGA
eukprot:Rmarinus@m.23781